MNPRDSFPARFSRLFRPSFSRPWEAVLHPLRAVARRAAPPLLALAAGVSATAAFNYSTPYAFTTMAGLASLGSADGPAAAARFASPHDVAVDAAGNLYVADKENHTIRKITPAGIVSTLAGSAGRPGAVDGTGDAARFNQPFSVTIDATGNLYVADTINLTIRKITPDGAVTTLAGAAGSYGTADGTGPAARFQVPSGIAVDAAGNLYVTDSVNNMIRKITPAGDVTTLAGTPGVYGSADGTGAAASFFYPFAIAVDAAGNVYVTEIGNYTIRKITPAGVVTTLAGSAGSFGSADGTGADARFKFPQGIAVDASGNVYVADAAIRKITPDGVVTTLAGSADTPGSADGTGSAASFRAASGMTIDAAGNLYVADRDNNTIRRITPAGVVTTVAGLGLDASVGAADGSGSAARFNSLASAAVGPDGSVYVADTVNSTIRKVSAAGVVTTFAGKAGAPGSVDGTGAAARFERPYGIAVDAAGTVYVTDPGNDTIRKITPASVVTTLAGDAGQAPGRDDGTGSAARFDYPAGIAVDATGNVFVADRDNAAIRKITSGGVVSTLADGGFAKPEGVAVDAGGNVYVADSIRHGAIAKITPAGDVTTLAGGSGGDEDSADGTGDAARFDQPQGLAIDATGNVFVAEAGSHMIRKVTPEGVVSTLAGLADAPGSSDGLGDASRFQSPQGIAANAQGTVFVTSGTTVRAGQVAAAPVITTQPASQAVAAGASVQLTVAAGGAPAPTYQWFRQGTALAGATGASLSLASAQAADAGDYTVTVTNALGSVTSSPATVTVSAAANPPPAGGTGGGSSGGGSCDVWFALALLSAAGARHILTRGRGVPASPAQRAR
jgi:sugar lactone lactonase YvrE